MYNKIKTISGVILIGAIGSLLYDVLLKDIFFFLGSIFVDGATFISSGYVDYLYKDVGKGSIYFALLPSIFIIVCVLISPYYFYLKINSIYAKHEQSPQLENKSVVRKPFYYLAKKKSRMNIFIIIFSIPMVLLYSDLLIKEMSTIKACSKIERNLEIARPYITNKEYLLLRSNYRLIDDKKKLADLIKQLEKIGVEKKIDLPEIELLGL